MLKNEDKEKGCALPSPRNNINSARSHDHTVALAAPNGPAQDLAINNKSWTRKRITVFFLPLPTKLLDTDGFWRRGQLFSLVVYRHTYNTTKLQ